MYEHLISSLGIHPHFATYVKPEICIDCPLEFMCKPDIRQMHVFCPIASHGIKFVIHKLCFNFNVREYDAIVRESDVIPPSLEYRQRSLEDVLWEIKTKTQLIVNPEDIK